MQAISKGLEKVEQELTEAENDGPISETFRKVSNITIIWLDLVVWKYSLLFFGCPLSALPWIIPLSALPWIINTIPSTEIDFGLNPTIANLN